MEAGRVSGVGSVQCVVLFYVLSSFASFSFFYLMIPWNWLRSRGLDWAIVVVTIGPG